MVGTTKVERDTSAETTPIVTSHPANISALRCGSYTSRIIVAGTRDWGDYNWFRQALAHYLVENHKGEHIAFIGGEARTGADAFIKRWCLNTPFDYYGFAARWNELGKGAGFRRNGEMALEGTHLLNFWDQRSPGTRDMIKRAEEHGLIVHGVDISTGRGFIPN